MITQALFRALDRRAIWLVAVFLVLAAAIPAANLLIPQGQFGHVPTYAVSIFGRYLSYAMLALALDLVWGYCGILSLGHAAFFALGGYAMGMYLMRQIGTRGVYGHPTLPDFMVFLNWQELPWYWWGFDNFWFAMAMVILVPGLLAFVFGFFAFRSRVTGVYLSIITQALTFALLLAFFRNDMGFGGNNGLTDFKDILGQPIQAQTTRAALFAATAIALALSVLICSMIVNSKLGKVMVAVRDAESRTRFLGYRVEYVKLFAFTVSAIIAGIAGALYVPQVGIINPSEFEPGNSIEVVIWTAVGGRGTLVGPIVGAIFVNLMKTIFTSGASYLVGGLFIVAFAAIVAVASGWQRGLIVLAGFAAVPALFGAISFIATGSLQFPSLALVWLFALGGLFIFSTLFLPQGIAGLVAQWRSRRAVRDVPRPSQSDAPSAPPADPKPQPAE